MKTAVKEVFVAALLSENYVQGTGRLRTAPGCFCVLGVLCDLYNKANPNTSGWRDEYGFKLFRAIDTEGVEIDTAHELPYVVREWAGLSEESADALVTLNDGTETMKPMSFKDIALFVQRVF
jgi:hypothetical protein